MRNWFAYDDSFPNALENDYIIRSSGKAGSFMPRASRNC